jgi:hypothetical protein
MRCRYRDEACGASMWLPGGGVFEELPAVVPALAFEIDSTLQAAVAFSDKNRPDALYLHQHPRSSPL